MQGKQAPEMEEMEVETPEATEEVEMEETPTQT
jgi:hypothetical protein